MNGRKMWTSPTLTPKVLYMRVIGESMSPMSISIVLMSPSLLPRMMIQP